MVQGDSCKKGSTRLLELTRGALALCRWTLGSGRHRYAIIAKTYELGADPMAYGGINEWTPPRKMGGIP